MALRKPPTRPGASLFCDVAIEPPNPAAAAAAYRANIDGGSRGNPGPASYGVVIRDPRGEIVAKLKKYIGRMTNNVAEYYGLIAALDYAHSHNIKSLRVEADSELLVKQMRGRYKVKSSELRPLFERARKMSQALDFFRIDHVYREQNQEADALANEALDETSGRPPAPPKAATLGKSSRAMAKPEAPSSSAPARSDAPSAAAQSEAANPAHASPGKQHARSKAVASSSTRHADDARNVVASADRPDGPRPAKPPIKTYRARYRGGVLYLLEDVDFPDGDEVEVLIRPLRKP
jgi:ribonuclease HI